jgi:hypothetical protein
VHNPIQGPKKGVVFLFGSNIGAVMGIVGAAMYICRRCSGRQSDSNTLSINRVHIPIQGPENTVYIPIQGPQNRVHNRIQGPGNGDVRLATLLRDDCSNGQWFFSGHPNHNKFDDHSFSKDSL